MLLDLLAPPLCWSCRSPAARGSALCRGCRRTLRFLGEAGRLVAVEGPPPAPPPPRAPPAPSTPPFPIWAAVAYEGAARELVRALKFHAATAVAEEMAAVIVASAPASLLAGTLVPVPLHPARERARGFNQAERLAGAIAARAELRRAGVLCRSGPDRGQVGRDRSARLRGPAGTIRARGPAPPTAVLVDDVVTTGATLAACASQLRAAGSAHVAALAFARTVGR